MTTPRAQHHCRACGFASPKWFGRCPECGGWSTAGEKGPSETSAEIRTLSAGSTPAPRASTGVEEVDRVLGGGLVPGSVILLAGEPGIGKSTLMLQLIAGAMERGTRCLLATGEESLDQVAGRAQRLGLDLGAIKGVATSSVTEVVRLTSAEAPGVLVVDSIQTLEDGALEQGPGSPTQVRHCATALIRYAKTTGCSVVLVGHVTKEGSVAGPKVLEHVVDAVLALEGERTGTMRLLRATKNRFGACDETGVFTMTSAGLETVDDPSEMLLADRREGVSGSCVFPVLEGSRPVLVELQALVTDSAPGQARRVCIGLDARRVAMLLGVLGKDDVVKLGDSDVFAAAAGGFAVAEPAADLAVALAIASAKHGRALPSNLVAIGEVGLGGEVRRVPGIDRRLAEARRMGFTHALVPKGGVRNGSLRDVVEVDDVNSAVARAFSEQRPSELVGAVC